MKPLLIFCILLCLTVVHTRRKRRLRIQMKQEQTEVYSWKQLTYNINGKILTTETPSFENLNNDDTIRGRFKRHYDLIYFEGRPDEGNDWKRRYPPGQLNEVTSTQSSRSQNQSDIGLDKHAHSFFIPYNNVPMGAEKVDNRLFITLPRRRYGIPSTLNYIDLNSEMTRSPSLRPYPNFNDSRSLVSVYRTRADGCGRLWMVDTGLLEIPENPQQVQRPAIVAFDLKTDKQILRYELKDSDVPVNTPTILASITIDTRSGCSDAYAYVPDLTTNGLIVFSLRERDSWRFSNNYFHFNPVASNLNSSDQLFQWTDGIFSITLSPVSEGCRTAYFHPMISFHEFSVSTCVLRNRTAASDSTIWKQFNIVGDRGPYTQCTMHDTHDPTSTIFFAEIGRDTISCWNTRTPLKPDNINVLVRDQTRLSYPSDLHVTGDELWVISNKLPRFGYAHLDTNEFNFYVLKWVIRDLIAGTACAEERFSSNLTLEHKIENTI